MSKKISYRKEQLPNYISRLKNMVELNFKIMIEPIASDISKEKYHNIVKGRRYAAEQSIKGMKRVDGCYKELDNLKDEELSSYYRENLPILIENLKLLFQLNLEVIDIEIDIEEGEWISEEKLHNLVKSRDMGSDDSDWALTKIDELETELNTKEDTVVVKQSFAKRAANKNKELATGKLNE